MKIFFQGGGLEGDRVKGMILVHGLELVVLETASPSSESRAHLCYCLHRFLHVYPGGANGHPGDQSLAVSHFGNTCTNSEMNPKMLA